MSTPLNIIIVEKSGTLKTLSIKDFKEDELFKKCSFKKETGFIKQTEWNVKINKIKYNVHVYAKSDGRANNENKYDFPPPIDTKLFFGNCAIISYVSENGKKKPIDLTIPLWTKIYEKLFGGFEDLASTALEDEEEEDELANVPKEKKTKDGYLKDGFVVSSDSEEKDEDSFDEDVSDDTDDEEEEEEELIVDDIGSELSEDKYDYDST